MATTPAPRTGTSLCITIASQPVDRPAGAESIAWLYDRMRREHVVCWGGEVHTYPLHVSGWAHVHAGEHYGRWLALRAEKAGILAT